MRYMTTAEIREKFLAFFEDKGCKRMPSSSLIPDDPSLLLTSAGMVQFKPYFLHVKELDPQFIGTTTVQKCVRTNDIDIIGTTGRHLSFFEMLGNFSFGKYFKKEMCAWALEFSTEVLGLPIERLYCTVFLDDDETIEIWKSLGIPEERISKLGEEDNFWRAGPTGPCGPCSEIYYDQGPEFGCGSPDCAPGCDCDRFLEYWNLVFTQYDGQEDGTLAPLPTKNIDTGMGLERMAAIMQGVQSNYETDVMRDLIAVGERLSGKTYRGGTNVGAAARSGDEQAGIDLALRIVADHSRSVSFMLADGILPGNEGRSYVLRRLLRRAIMNGYKIGIDVPFLGEYFKVIVEKMGHVYPEIVANRELVEKYIAVEEERFGRTLRRGLAYLDDALVELGEGEMLPGEVAFELHDTYGFPVELTREICEDRGIEVDEQGFGACMAAQRERARAATKGDNEAAWSTYGGVHADLLRELGPTEFVGYSETETFARVVALIRDGERVSVLEEGQEGEVILNTTPFYAEMGGEVGDTGVICAADVTAVVSDTKAPEKGLICHYVKIENGDLKEGRSIMAAVDTERRARITRNHTGTHILHAALRNVLGSHVNQAGSYVGPDRLRFDFTHFQGMTRDEIRAVEDLANAEIMKAVPLDIYETTLDEARASGVTALFGEKYGERVRVVKAGDFSAELCGGCHVGNTAEIGFLKIVSEGSVGANVRRIEAVTSYEALAYVNSMEAELRQASEALRVPVLGVAERAAANLQQLKEIQRRGKKLRTALEDDTITDVMREAVIDVGYPLLVTRRDDLDTAGLRSYWDSVRDRMGAPGAVVIGTVHEGKPMIMAAGTDEAVAKGFNAGAVIKQVVGLIDGRGGGKPTMAQAGGKDASGLDAALDAARKMLGA